MTPYDALSARNFWSPAVGKREALEIDELWVPKWPVVSGDTVVTFGSCFAQHFGRALSERGYGWTNMEPGPVGLGPEAIEKYNYNVFSARTGNIYTTNILRQWCDWATGRALPPDEVWEAEGRYYDPFRPAIEPNGFESVQEVRESRELTMEAFGDAIRRADVFVFTLGLTESWRVADQSHEYAICPGTAAGTFDPERHVFVNETYPGITAALRAALAVMREINPGLRILLTVSPVPLTATASDDHVLVATTYSKSVLRAVAGDVAAGDPLVDYFPSYEIITAPAYGGRFFAANKRSVLPEGVAHVMDQFFKGQVAKYGAPAVDAVAPKVVVADDDEPDGDDLVCEEALLAAFGPRV
jgi:GSCFA family